MMYHRKDLLLLDGEPTWDPEQGPEIIQRQLDLLEKIAEEFTPVLDERDRGIHERLDLAREYYAELLSIMLDRCFGLKKCTSSRFPFLITIL